MTNTPPVSTTQGLAKSAAHNVLRQHAAEIRRLGKRVIADIIEIGRRLSHAKTLLAHGTWLPWLERELGWTEQTALNLMRCHDLAKSKNFGDLNLPVSGLYLLAAPSTPDEARDGIIERAKNGEALSVKDVRQVIAEARTARGPAENPAPPPLMVERQERKAVQDTAARRDDIGENSFGELERLRVRIHELEVENRRLHQQQQQPYGFDALVDTWLHTDERACQEFLRWLEIRYGERGRVLDVLGGDDTEDIPPGLRRERAEAAT